MFYLIPYIINPYLMEALPNEVRLELQKNKILRSLIRGIENIARSHPTVKYNGSILEHLFEQVEIAVTDPARSIERPDDYANEVGARWAIGQLRKEDIKARRKEKERMLVEEEINQVVSEVKLKIAKQELKIVIEDLIENYELTETQQNQLRYLLVSLLNGYPAADAQFSDVSSAAKRQWRKRARDLVLAQPITDNLRWHLDDSERQKVEFESRWRKRGTSDL